MSGLKERKGWEWKEITKDSGYWVKSEPDKAHKHKLNFFCPNCGKITGSLDDESLLSMGICKECVVMYVEDRQVPAIDLSKFKK